MFDNIFCTKNMLQWNKTNEFGNDKRLKYK